MEIAEAERILASLEREGVRYVLIGSMAMAAQGLIRATRDMDLMVSPDPDNIERLRRALRSVFNDPNIDEIRSEDLKGDYPALEYTPPHGEFSIDILSRLGEAYSYNSLEWEEMLVDDVRVRVATPRMLYRMKSGTVRPVDRIDAAALLERFGPFEEKQ